MGVPRRLRIAGRLLNLYRDFCLAPRFYRVPCFRRWSAGLSLSFPARGWSCGPLLEADASVKSKPASHGKVTVVRQEAQELQPWVTHRRLRRRPAGCRHRAVGHRPADRHGVRDDAGVYLRIGYRMPDGRRPAFPSSNSCHLPMSHYPLCRGDETTRFRVCCDFRIGCVPIPVFSYLLSRLPPSWLCDAFVPQFGKTCGALHRIAHFPCRLCIFPYFVFRLC